MIQKRLLQNIFIMLLLTPLFSHAQEVLVPLTGNPVLQNILVSPAGKLSEKTKASNGANAVTLPFYDDFTYSSVVPDQSLWSDWHVFVNSDFAYHSFNRGVATFDALDSAGNIYSNATFAPFEADRLTSRGIRLDSIFTPQKRAIVLADSVYLSFYYQPQGLGNSPQPADSLLLQFLTTDPVPYWVTIWSEEGMKLDTFYTKYGTYSRRVNIPITDSASYFRSDFQFRFVAYASLSGDMLPSWQSSMDHWNVDAVKLDLNGRSNDSTQKWIGFAEKAPSMLKSFYSVPYTQYSAEPTAFMADTLSMYITNRYSENLPARYEYQVLKADGSVVSSYNGGNNTIPPFLSNGYFDFQPWAKPPVRSIIPIDPFGVQDSAIFYIRHALRGDESLPNSVGLGDTIVYEQKMTDFYAYDDGVPELGYGLTPAGAQLAVRFALTKADTLRAVRLYFNKVVANANQQYYYLTVWDDNNGTPGRILNADTILRPTFADSMFRYTQVTLKNSVPVRNAFYVGWVQTTDDNLNIGFDRSRDNQNNNFYNTDGTWQRSQFPGAIMIRPVIGKRLLPEADNPTLNKSGMELWPSVWNQSGDVNVVINGVVPQAINVEMYDLSGRLVLSQQTESRFRPDGCREGAYVVKVRLTDTGKSYTHKLIIIQ
ncbi:MAG TPA: hypothetical protein DEO70_10275 [Bacteroidales bacterium]|nr:MAG: hypothetical protein A2X11_14350 [Bacteroidetes bacterium GWE2_42_24]OFY31536.1 MAG: hypothetical protein A2X09_08090 [Bacteroidetes bacterium GWF2_43_11]HBZ67214.1 hypothetical protein [Bacteroidales bacterium]